MSPRVIQAHLRILETDKNHAFNLGSRATTIHDMHMCHDTLATTSLLGTPCGVGREHSIIEAPTDYQYECEHEHANMSVPIANNRLQ